jgi:hypothetical protein
MCCAGAFTAFAAHPTRSVSAARDGIRNSGRATHRADRRDRGGRPVRRAKQARSHRARDHGDAKRGRRGLPQHDSDTVRCTDNSIRAASCARSELPSHASRRERGLRPSVGRERETQRRWDDVTHRDHHRPVGRPRVHGTGGRLPRRRPGSRGCCDTDLRSRRCARPEFGPVLAVLQTSGTVLSVQHGTATVAIEVQAGDQQLSQGLSTSLLLPKS